MRIASWILASGVVSLVVALHVGCWSDYEDLYLPLTDPKLASDGGAGGNDSGPPPACIPGESDTPVDDTCGVFVSSSLGADGAAGTKGAPLKSLQQAIDQAKGRAVYACAETFAGSVTLASGGTIYGGLNCSDGWSYVGTTTKSALMGDADKVALTLASTAKGAEIVDFTIQAASAMTAGASSIAMLADQATVQLTRCELVAGNGAPGANGDDAPTPPAQAGASGNPGGDACSGYTVLGGAQAKNDCGTDKLFGGKGGDGHQDNGTAGSPGLPTSGSGQAGQGDDGSAGWSCALNGGTGGRGAPGQAGMPGEGAPMANLGMLTSSGFLNAAGGDGQPGKIGQGGGGGGGVRGDTTVGQMLCGSGKPVGGASGGCGGGGGKGGQGGGASLALVSTIGAAGKGGLGGNGNLSGNQGADGAAAPVQVFP